MKNTKKATRTHTTKDQALPNEKTSGPHRHHPAEKAGNAGNGGVDQKPTKSQTRKTAQTHDLAESGT
jgi:hypothetical protein